MCQIDCISCSDDPDIEENDDSCVIRIAPKPIKIKIKMPPVELQSPVPNPSPFYMHPKKKMVQMDSMAHVHEVNGVGPLEPNDSFQSELRSEESFSQLENWSNKSGLLSSSSSSTQNQSSSTQNQNITTQNQSSTTQNQSSTTQNQSSSTQNQSWDKSEQRMAGELPDIIINDNGEGRTRRNRTSGTVKKGRDKSTKCDVCQGEGDNSNLVR